MTVAQTTPTLQRVLVAAGGTGGHIFPALSVAEALRAEGVSLRWVGTDRGLEARVTTEAKIPLDRLDFQGVRGRGLKGLAMLPIRLVRAMAQAARVFNEFKPELVVSFGGYVTVPVGLIARLRGVPLIIHEQNAVMGSANRFLARLASAVAVSFPETRRAPKSAEQTGNPVRATLLSLSAATPRIEGWDGPIRLLVLGGSLGARPLNQALPITIARLKASGQSVEVWHQTGTADEGSTRTAYESLGLGESARVQAFIDDMTAAYRWADLVVCRSGASTVTELMALGQPALFVPLPHAIDDHQTWNAAALVSMGGARLVPQRPQLAEDLVQVLSDLNRPALVQMAKRAEAQRDLGATERVVGLLRRIHQTQGLTS